MLTARRARDHWLALRCQADEPGAFEDLCAAVEQPLFYYALKLVRNQDTALDILQETWIRALRGIAKLKEPGSVRSWLYCLLHGIAVDHVRREQARQRIEEMHVELAQNVEDTDFTSADAGAVHDALDRLSEKHREVLVLHFLEDFSLAEISGIVGCPEGTVKSRLHHAKAEMKAILSGGGYGTRS